MNDACELKNRDCVPCKGGVPPLSEIMCRKLLSNLDADWILVENHHIERLFKFPDFKQALAFTNEIGRIAEEQNHHPDIELGWGRVKVTIFTHKIKGLTESDFIFAAKADSIL